MLNRTIRQIAGRARQRCHTDGEATMAEAEELRATLLDITCSRGTPNDEFRIELPSDWLDWLETHEASRRRAVWSGVGLGRSRPNRGLQSFRKQPRQLIARVQLELAQQIRRMKLRGPRRDSED